MNHFSPRFLILRLLNEQKNSGPAGLCLPLCPELKSPCCAPRGRSAKMCWLLFFNIRAKIYLQIQPSPSVHPEPQNKAYFLLIPHRASALETWLGTGVDCMSRKHCTAFLPLVSLLQHWPKTQLFPWPCQGDLREQMHSGKQTWMFGAPVAKFSAFPSCHHTVLGTHTTEQLPMMVSVDYQFDRTWLGHLGHLPPGSLLRDYLE